MLESVASISTRQTTPKGESLIDLCTIDAAKSSLIGDKMSDVIITEPGQFILHICADGGGGKQLGSGQLNQH